ncbi:MAG: hypothetical protein Fur0037_13730 [Planctomycetota bacterium]
MNVREFVEAIDGIATADPARFGHGYADTQYPWRQDPAIDLPRSVVHEWMLFLGRRGILGKAVVRGFQGKGGIQRVLGLLIESIVTLRSPDEGVPGACVREGRDHVLVFDPSAPGAADAAESALRGANLLLLDGSSADFAEEFRRLAPCAPPGCLVAFADGSQAGLARAPVDRFAADLERFALRPAGASLHRIGDAHGLCWFEQSVLTARRVGMIRVPCRPERERPVFAAGMDLQRVGPRWVAVPAAGAAIDRVRLRRNGYRLVLAAPSEASCAKLARDFGTAGPLLEKALDLLAAGDVEHASRAAASVAREFPDLASGLRRSLELAPFCLDLLLPAAMSSLFSDRPREGLALLRAALEQAPVEKRILLAARNACERVLGDAEATAEILDETRNRIRWIERARICRDRLRGRALWRYPRLVRDLRSAVVAGGSPDLASELRLLGIEDVFFAQPEPEAFAALTALLAGWERAKAVRCALGSAPGAARLRIGKRRRHASLLGEHPLAEIAAEDRQASSIEVPRRSLDDLAASGAIDPRRAELLWIDAEGSELEILRGSRSLLPNVDVIVVSVLTEPIYEGAPLPQQIQAWLSDLERDSFALRAFEPSPERGRGEAIYLRRRIRR